MISDRPPPSFRNEVDPESRVSSRKFDELASQHEGGHPEGSPCTFWEASFHDGGQHMRPEEALSGAVRESWSEDRPSTFGSQHLAEVCDNLADLSSLLNEATKEWQRETIFSPSGLTPTPRRIVSLPEDVGPWHPVPEEDPRLDIEDLVRRRRGGLLEESELETSASELGSAFNGSQPASDETTTNLRSGSVVHSMLAMEDWKTTRSRSVRDLLGEAPKMSQRRP
eukprot:TRINITY_DN24293_c0_g1_i4.p1 TRINITY_DN24293_c0_g1~~TRINITY_DN24293_c0_g1_i4.p1  ORF type:complete len:225 (+),score=37.09 TRINITY_DN24293_c0_g1_i4:151-825(+)